MTARIDTVTPATFTLGGQIRRSIRDTLFALPGGTVVKTGHGPDTTIMAERAAFD